MIFFKHVGVLTIRVGLSTKQQKGETIRINQGFDAGSNSGVRF